jgi:hypothetical protein
VTLQWLSRLRSERREARTSYIRNPPVVWIGYDIEQFLDTIASDRGDNSELTKMGADRIDHCGLLPDLAASLRALLTIYRAIVAVWSWPLRIANAGYATLFRFRTSKKYKNPPITAYRCRSSDSNWISSTSTARKAITCVKG